MRFAAIAEIVGQMVALDEGRGQIISTDGWGSGSTCYARIRLEDGSVTCRQTAHILPMLSTKRSTAMPAVKSRRAAKKSVAETVTEIADKAAAPVVVVVPESELEPADPLNLDLADAAVDVAEIDAPIKAAKPAKAPSKLAVAMEGTDAELAAFLLANVTYPDTSWKSRAGGKSRRKGETREAFIRRVLLGVVA